MELKKYTCLSDEQLKEIEHFINSNSFNQGISFLENDMNYYEDFPCFFMLFHKEELVAFLSVFIPDSASCELYFHIADKMQDSAYKLFTEIYDELEYDLDDYDLFNRYILFDNNEMPSKQMQHQLKMIFSHSECLMQYDLSYAFDSIIPSLSCEVRKDTDNITITTYLGDTLIGKCQAEVSDNYALIHDVEVLKKHRGLGYGTETLYHTINFLTENGYKNILLHVNSANTIAYAMYSHYGFKIKQQIDYWKL